LVRHGPQTVLCVVQKPAEQRYLPCASEVVEAFQNWNINFEVARMRGAAM
jgi:hypothetical protein